MIFAFRVEANENGTVTIATPDGTALHVLIPDGMGWQKDGVEFYLSPLGYFRCETQQPVRRPR